MPLYLLSFLAGLATILSPCILPVLPFVLGRANLPWTRGALPALLGLAVAFAGAASLVGSAWTWVPEAHAGGRSAALILLTVSGTLLLFPSLATTLARPLVAAGIWLGPRSRLHGRSPAASLLVGASAGLIWAPCAGPILAAVLAASALQGPSVSTTGALLAYAAGAVSAIGLVLALGRRLSTGLSFSGMRKFPFGRATGVAVLVSVAVVGSGADTRILQPLSNPVTQKLEGHLVRIAGARADVPPLAEAPRIFAGRDPAHAIERASDWIGGSGKPGTLRLGRVTVVSFWTYSCINCLRALPHLKDWSQRYAQEGLVVVGVHSPEFAFEKETRNVARAVRALDIRYPVLVDNDFGIWRAFGNRGWPGIHVLDASGRVVFSALGEGQYGRVEAVIHGLLRRSAGQPISIPAAASDVEVGADWAGLSSPETYLGSSKATRFAGSAAETPSSGAQAHPRDLKLNHWSLSGIWRVNPEFARLEQRQGSIRYRFRARDLHLVMRPSRAGRSVRFRVSLDGAAPGEHAGADVDGSGSGIVSAGRLHQLVRQRDGSRERLFEIEFLEPGVEVYAFTFG